MFTQRFAAVLFGGIVCLFGLGDSTAQSAPQEPPWCLARPDKTICSYVGRFATYEACEKERDYQEDFRCFNVQQYYERRAEARKAWSDSIASKKSKVEPHLQEAIELIFSSSESDAFFSDVRTCVVEVWQKPQGNPAYLRRKIYLNTLDPRHASVAMQTSVFNNLAVYQLNVPGSSTAVEDFDANGTLSKKSKDLSQSVGISPTTTEHELQRKMNAFAFLYSKQCKGTARPF